MSTPFEWTTATPESRGLDGRAIQAWVEALAARGTAALLVTRHDRIVVEWYAPGHGPAALHGTASLAKALVGGLSLILALGDGLLAPDEPAARSIPQWRDHPLRSLVTIRHLATHSSGIEDAEAEGIGHMELGGWMEAFWRRDPDPFSVSRDHAPFIFRPGTGYAYSNPGMAMLAYAVTAALQGSAHEDIRTLLRERVMRPIGIGDDEWSVGYGETPVVDGLRLVANWGGGAFTARAVARLGRLMMHRGEWLGRGQVLDAAWVDRALAYAGTPIPPRPAGNPQPLPGLAWWLNADGAWPNVPRDAFGGAGAGNQMLLVIPSLDLVVVRNGATLGDPAAGEGFWGGAVKYLFDPLMAAISSPRPAASAPSAGAYPPSPAIRNVRFAPVEEIARHGVDSDNWPITWAEDDLQYTAYGDGYGFEPHIEEKLSLGFGVVEGDPPALVCRNLRAPTGERLGGGAAGLKASGLLAVGGALYMLARNAGNACLAWSEDRGRTWEWADWRWTESMGCPTFLNCGRGYRDAPDDYAYLYSPDGPSAYEPADGIVLARAPVARLREAGAYEYFSGLDGEGRPVWTAEISERRPVFRYPGRCQRLDAVYHPALGRYLLAVGYNHRGGWGLYDAPAPWGPWTSVYHTTYWGLGNTHYYRLPPRWLAADGRGLWMAFSGRTYDGVVYDAMCLRRVEWDLVDP